MAIIIDNLLVLLYKSKNIEKCIELGKKLDDLNLTSQFVSNWENRTIWTDATL